MKNNFTDQTKTTKRKSSDAADALAQKIARFPEFINYITRVRTEKALQEHHIVPAHPACALQDSKTARMFLINKIKQDGITTDDEIINSAIQIAYLDDELHKRDLKQ